MTKRNSALRSYDSGKPLRSISPRRSSSAFGYRKPSVVTRETFGCSGQWASSSRSRRAVVDLPTATEPAMPITNGVRCGGRARQEEARSPVQGADVTDVQAEQPRDRQVHAVTSSRSSSSPSPRSRSTSAADSGSGIWSARAAQSLGPARRTAKGRRRHGRHGLCDTLRRAVRAQAGEAHTRPRSPEADGGR